MRKGLIVLGAVALILAVAGLLKLAPAGSQGSAATTEWGEPDLQGIWSNDFDTPLQRPTRYADKEFLTDEERADLDRRRAAAMGRDRRSEIGTDNDVAGAYNAVFVSVKHTGRRTSLVVDPPDGKVSPLTEEAKQRNAVQREYGPDPIRWTGWLSRSTVRYFSSSLSLNAVKKADGRSVACPSSSVADALGGPKPPSS